MKKMGKLKFSLQIIALFHIILYQIYFQVVNWFRLYLVRCCDGDHKPESPGRGNLRRGST